MEFTADFTFDRCSMRTQVENRRQIGQSLEYSLHYDALSNTVVKQKHVSSGSDAPGMGVLLASPVNSGSSLLDPILSRLLSLCGYVSLGHGSLNNISRTAGVHRLLERVLPGFYHWGHYKWEEAKIIADRARLIWLCRDPRDALVSHYHTIRYASSGYRLWDGYRQYFEDSALDEHAGLERFVMGFDYANAHGSGECRMVQWQARQYGDWLQARESGECLLVRFEDIVGNMEGEVGRILNHLGIELPSEDIRQAILDSDPFSRGDLIRGKKRPGTFHRCGGGKYWSETFSPAMKQMVKNHQGGLLVGLGYEAGLDW